MTNQPTAIDQPKQSAKPPLKYVDQVGAEIAATSRDNKYYTSQQVQDLLNISKATRQNYYKLLHLETLKQGRESLISDFQLDAVRYIAEYMQAPAAAGNRKFPDDTLQTLRRMGYSVPKSQRELQLEAEQDAIEEGKPLKTEVIKSPEKRNRIPILKPVKESEILRFFSSIFPDILSQFSRELGESINQKSEAEQLLEDFEVLDRRYEILEKSASNKRKLPSSDLARILGLKSIPNKGSSFNRYGFLFQKSGKSGAQTTWIVMQEG